MAATVINNINDRIKDKTNELNIALNIHEL
jgi:hypothetical protein